MDFDYTPQTDTMKNLNELYTKYNLRDKLMLILLSARDDLFRAYIS